jgi:hypothetical protein
MTKSTKTRAARDPGRCAGTGTSSSRPNIGTTSKHGLYYRHFTPEQIAKLDTISSEQFLEDLYHWLLDFALDLFLRPDLTGRERLQISRIINTIVRRINP